ncbi:putative endonuclease 4 [Desulfuromonas versatilis]|uniref:Probable endonuclease 4 n=1 Tax=Desulfuromonas versatilis TaxID=2802975 RepID=A0ABN6DTV3_9BACT|nr:deoxyribonuclease IV [Desulfuromonas versatilis]BCR03505.1 putative endonuclease 4 [Desulfuromonas versatilis]
MLLLGAHMSIAGGVETAFARGEKVGCTAMQIFTKNANQWRGKPICAESARAFAQAWQASSIGPVIAHDTYLINLASPEEDKWRRSIEAFLDEMRRCALLGVPALVMHPGAHLGSGEQAGLARLCAAFRLIFAEAPAEVRVLLENTAGQGSCLGAPLEHLAAVFEGVPQGRFGVCFDTCHAFAAGHDLSSAEGYEAVMAEFDRLVGLERIEAFHLNDSKKGLGSRVDRHEHIGRGALGRACFEALMRDQRFSGVPKILETPKGDDDEFDLMNLALLREMAGECQ